MNPLSVKFASNDLSVFDGVELYNHDFNLLPKRDIKIHKVAQRDLSIITSSEYVSKDISIYMDVCGGSRADTEVLLTFMKSLVQTQNGELLISQGGEDISYTATMNEFNYQWSGVTALVTIVFIASNPVGRTVDEQTLTSISGNTAATVTVTFPVEGSATALPYITASLNAVTGATNQSMTITNSRTNQGITVTRTWLAGDILTVDSEALEARVNGTIVDFTGLFPEYNTGESQLSYSDTFTTRTVDITATYHPRLL